MPSNTEGCACAPAASRVRGVALLVPVAPAVTGTLPPSIGTEPNSGTLPMPPDDPADPDVSPDTAALPLVPLSSAPLSLAEPSESAEPLDATTLTPMPP